MFHQNQSWYSIFIGNGPNYDSYYFVEKIGTVTLAFNYITIVFFNYGVVGEVVAIVWMVFAFFVLRRTEYSLLYASSLSYALLNSASGVVNYIYFYALLMVALFLRAQMHADSNIRQRKHDSYGSVG